MTFLTVNLSIAILLVASIRVVSSQTNAKAERRSESARSPLVTQRELNMFVAGKEQAARANGTFMEVVTGSLLSAVRLHEDISNDTSCNTTWTHPTGNGSCECGDLLNGAIRCNLSSHTLSILNCYCMTYDEGTGATVAGECVYNCDYITSDIYHVLPLSLSSLNDKMCGHLNRTGRLCGQCQYGSKQPAYFYGYRCVNCTNNWLKYIALAFVPLTLFLVIVLCFRISVTSPQLNAFVFCSQVISAPQALYGTLYIEIGWSNSVMQIGATIYGIWNLDFFRTLFPEICLDLDLSSIQLLALDYAIAFYPLLLMIIFYVLIELHDSNFRPVVYMWRPFHRCLSRFMRQWNAKNSIVDAFVTFLLLSYTKILSVSANLLLPTWIYNVYGQKIGLYLYYDATIRYFGEEHLPYALFALFVFFTFILAPLLLLILYPMRCFQRCRFRVRWHALHIFADSFQGCYKDGTNGTRDCRYFAAVYLIVRIIMIALFEAIKHTMVIFWECLVLFLFCISIAIIRPYKPKYSVYNTIDTMLILQLAILLMSMLGFLITKFNTETNFFARKLTLLGLSCIIGMLPLVYFFFTILHWLCCHKYFTKMFPRRRASQNSLPDRIVNPDRYNEELLHNPLH